MRFFSSIIVVFLFASIAFSQHPDRIREVKNLIDQREIQKAKTILNELYEEDDETPEVNYWLGVVALMENNYDDAIDFLDDAIDVDESNDRYYYMLGNAYGMKAQNAGVFKAAFAAPKAKSNWEKALELNPDNFQAKQALFQYYLRAPGIMGGDDDKAKQMAFNILKKTPGLGHNYLAMYYLIGEENPEKAEQELNNAMQVDSTDSLFGRINSSNLSLLNQLGYYYLGKEFPVRSRQFFVKAIALAPHAANPYDSMGDYYIAIAKYDSALIYFELALKQDAKFTTSLFKKGEMLEKLGRTQEAIAAFEEVVKNNPDGRFGEQASKKLEKLH